MEPKNPTPDVKHLSHNRSRERENTAAVTRAGDHFQVFLSTKSVKFQEIMHLGLEDICTCC